MVKSDEERLKIKRANSLKYYYEKVKPKREQLKALKKPKYTTSDEELEAIKERNRRYYREHHKSTGNPVGRPRKIIQDS